MRRSLSLIGGLCLGVALSQFPEYAQQYTQRLGGAVDELHAVVAAFDASTIRAGLTQDQALARYSSSSDSFLSAQGQSMRGNLARYARLSRSLAEIRSASPIGRLRHLPDYLDSEIGARTLDNFKPAVPVTMEGFAYAGAGLVAGYMVLSILISLIVLPFGRRRVWITRTYKRR